MFQQQSTNHHELKSSPVKYGKPWTTPVKQATFSLKMVDRVLW